MVKHSSIEQTTMKPQLDRLELVSDLRRALEAMDQKTPISNIVTMLAETEKEIHALEVKLKAKDGEDEIDKYDFEKKGKRVHRKKVNAGYDEPRGTIRRTKVNQSRLDRIAEGARGSSGKEVSFFLAAKKLKDRAKKLIPYFVSPAPLESAHRQHSLQLVKKWLEDCEKCTFLDDGSQPATLHHRESNMKRHTYCKEHTINIDEISQKTHHIRHRHQHRQGNRAAIKLPGNSLGLVNSPRLSSGSKVPLAAEDHKSERCIRHPLETRGSCKDGRFGHKSCEVEPNVILDSQAQWRSLKM